ncbi:MULTISPECIES: anthranilate phosphoribosyltransferase [unclassified Ruminococcus]|uniref:anthranilate phosphoribosyltransferase n=1 Tax=unclassified Ruminococcus TaxID=2608920 RepID=UPI0021089913|nr:MULTISPECIES: anthranilate phosphoribosyltransferase [unclassified Ruminococcus]MCQ4022752.1 anthranilate phosphoribosyltransferase [Ruminococcus sp. zg-924]MCQ4114992.1 anthranilate phosphoribosyltransferase [Ruminococcus sp. zg-921]
MIKNAIEKLINGENLGFDETKAVMNQIMSGEATNAQIASFLTALRIKGETPTEISACATVMRDKGIKLKRDFTVAEIVGTGGDCANTFNISTISGIVISAAGVPVAKHGNRSVSSKCGAADILEALGVNINLTPEQNKQVLKECGICFMFAQLYHSSMKYAAPVRRELGTRTVFNILGPLANPTGAEINLIGVYSSELVRPIAEVLQKLGVKRSMVIHGLDGLDEITLTDKTLACEINGDTLTEFEIDPEQYGFTLCESSELVGGDAQENAQIAVDILDGEKGAKRNIVLLNSAVVLYLAGKAQSIEDGIKLAAETIDSGKAKQQLEKFIKATNSFKIG